MALTLGGVVDLYHYSKIDLGQDVVLDPKETMSRRSQYSRNDYKLSNFPRVFYYMDLKKTEWQIKSNFLYTAKVNGDKILSLQSALEEYKKDKDGLKARDNRAWEVADALMGRGYQDWDAMFEAAAKNYLGIAYDRGNLPMVNIFKPLRVRKYAGS